MRENKRSMIPGIMLILVGLWIFSRNVFQDHSIWEKIYPFFLICFAGFQFIELFRTKRQQSLFWGVFFLLAGVFFLLRNYDFIPYLYFDEYWPIFLGIWGLSFLARFIFRPDDWGVLIPAMLFLFFGVVLFFNTAEGLLGDFDPDIERYWPLSLILIGCGVVISTLFKSRKGESDQV